MMGGTSNSNPFLRKADEFVCTVLPESPTVSVSYSPGAMDIEAVNFLPRILLVLVNYFCGGLISVN